MRCVFPALLWLVPVMLCAQGLRPEGLKELEAVVNRAVARQNPAGVVLWVEQGGKSHTLVKGAQSLIPVREEMALDTIFDAASLTKVVATAPCVMLLCEEGRVDLEAPLSRYLPEYVGEGREKICVRHLLTHTSGLKPGIPKEPLYASYREGLRRALTMAPEIPVDVTFRYSDVNFILLGELVRRVSGKGLELFATERIFHPLKMTRTRFLPPADWRDKIAPTERDENGVMLCGVVHDPTARRMGGVAGHAGLFTTAGDLAKFARMCLGLGGPQVLKPESLRRMQTVGTVATVYERRGLGWDIESAYSRPRGEVYPVGSFGHTGFTGTSLWMDPTSQSFVIFLSSRLHPAGGGSVRELYEEVGTAAAKAVTLPAEPAQDWNLTPREEKEVPTVLNGVDVLKREGFFPLKGQRVGLITNQTGSDAGRSSTIDLLAKAPGVKLRALFSPEHGIRGALDQEKIGDAVDKKTGLPIHSLYGERRAPTTEQLAELDVLVFDIQDIGCRFYTYISTLRLALEAAAKAGKKVLVLDRVNPIGGMTVEGPVQVEKETFTATHAIPIRHGMTVGELALMMNAERKIGAQLEVVRCEGWRREQVYDLTGLPWINPSPNMRTLEAALLYPGVGLLEFSISVGRGTDAPFELLGAPYVDDLRLGYELNKLGLPGLRFLPVRFTPTSSVFKDEACGGVRVQITDRAAVQSVATGLGIATVLQRLYPEKFALAKVGTLLNHPALLEALKAGKDWKQLRTLMVPETATFEPIRARHLLY